MEVDVAARYTLVLGTKEWSSWSLRPYLAMRATGADFDEIIVPLRQKDSRQQILKHSPAGKVPILKIEEDGRSLTVFDSLAICETLAERHPGAKLWPDDPQTRAIARAYACEMHSGFAAVRSMMSMEVARQLPAPAMRDDLKSDIMRILAAWEEALSAHGKDGGFLFGRFSIADCMYAPVVSRFRTYGIEIPATIRDYSERIFALPAMQDWIKAAEQEIAGGLPELATLT
jgi:glutathione S-transferase